MVLTEASAVPFLRRAVVSVDGLSVAIRLLPPKLLALRMRCTVAAWRSKLECWKKTPYCDTEVPIYDIFITQLHRYVV